MHPFRLHHQSSIPVTLQLREQIKHQVRLGLLQPGDQLPSLRELAEALGVNRNTVVNAFQELESTGWVRTHPGKGVFVTAAPPVQGSGAELRALLAGALRQAAALGLSAEAFALAALAHGQLQAPPDSPLTRVLAISGSRARAAALAAWLEGALPVVAAPAVPDELPGDPGTFALAVATVFHAAEVERTLGGTVPVLALGPADALAAVPRAVPLTVGAPDWVHAARIRRSLAAAGLDHPQIHLAADRETPVIAWEGGELVEPIQPSAALLEELQAALALPPEAPRRSVSPWF